MHLLLQGRGAFSRTGGGAFSGATIAQQGLTDHVYVSGGAQQIEDQGATFQARALLYREADQQVKSYFVRKGVHFLRNGLGFDADFIEVVLPAGSYRFR